MQTVSCLSGQCIGIADVLCSRSRMQMNHQILDSVQAVAILVKEGGIGVSESMEGDVLGDVGVLQPFLERLLRSHSGLVFEYSGGVLQEGAGDSNGGVEVVVKTFKVVP